MKKQDIEDCSLHGVEQQAEDDVVTIECLVCGSRQLARREHFHGHDSCDRCNQTTNHILIPEKA